MGRILFVASTFSHIWNFHRPYLADFSKQNWQVDVACAGTPLELPEAHNLYTLPLEKRMGSPKNLAAARQLRQLIAKNHYDLVSCHTSLASFFVRLAVIGLPRRPLVACTCHGYLFDQDTPALKRLILSTAEAITAPVTDLLMTMNQWDTDYATSHKLGRQVSYIPGMGVDPQRLTAPDSQQSLQLRQRLELPEDAFVLLFAGEFSPRKSQSVLLHALAQLPPQVYLLLPGQGSELEACRQLAHSLGVADRVRFPGQVSDLSSWYAACDAVVSASRSEGLPFNLMEAMYYARPIVASRVKGHSDLLEPDGVGLLYPYGDAAQCAQHVSHLIQNPDQARTMGLAAQQAVIPYLLPQVEPRIMDHYRNLIAQKGTLKL